MSDIAQLVYKTKLKTSIGITHGENKFGDSNNYYAALSELKHKTKISIN